MIPANCHVVKTNRNTSTLYLLHFEKYFCVRVNVLEMRQSLDASYDVHIVSFLHKIQCTISLNEGGIFITRKYQNPSDKIYIHKTCLIGCTKGVNSRWSEKCNACLRLTYFKLRKNFRKGNSLVALQKTNLNILFQSEKEACRCLKAMELHFQNTESAEVKPYLVIINPQSGTGNAMSIFSSKVAPIWKQMNIPYELLCTGNTIYDNEEV
ncbi:unnamed protein product [Heterobilharzia americana]|nr:unnamed protein product [Heterobilharzia americana]